MDQTARDGIARSADCPSDHGFGPTPPAGQPEAAWIETPPEIELVN